MPDPNDLLHSIVNGSPQFTAQYNDLLRGLGGDSASDLDPIDPATTHTDGALHQTLKAILGHLQGQSPAQPKTVQVIRDQGGRMVGAKVIPGA